MYASILESKNVKQDDKKKLIEVVSSRSKETSARDNLLNKLFDKNIVTEYWECFNTCSDCQSGTDNKNKRNSNDNQQQQAPTTTQILGASGTYKVSRSIGKQSLDFGRPDGEQVRKSAKKVKMAFRIPKKALSRATFLAHARF